MNICIYVMLTRDYRGHVLAKGRGGARLLATENKRMAADRPRGKISVQFGEIGLFSDFDSGE